MMAGEKITSSAAPAGRDVEAAVASPAVASDGHGKALSDKDEAIAMVGEQAQTLDPVVVARAVRKIDLFLIPVMIFGCKPLSIFTQHNQPPYSHPS